MTQNTKVNNQRGKNTNNIEFCVENTYLAQSLKNVAQQPYRRNTTPIISKVPLPLDLWIWLMDVKTHAKEETKSCS